MAPVNLESAIATATQTLLLDKLGKKISAYEHLIVVPVFDIGTFPFAVLKPADQPLVTTTAVSIAPSLQELARLTEYWEEGWNALIIGDPDFSAEGEWFFPPLPGARAEAEIIADRLGGTPLLGEQANPDNVLAGMKGRDLLYFATHAIADSEMPLEGFLALAGGRLTAREIQNMHLEPGVTVLSACQTALGGKHHAGVIGLSRAFMLAGTLRVVMSLWNVDDEATFVLMDTFSRRLGHKPPAVALRHAMLAARKRYADPLLWSGFLVFGGIDGTADDAEDEKTVRFQPRVTGREVEMPSLGGCHNWPPAVVSFCKP